MPNYDNSISELLSAMDPISLNEMSGIKLMNRIDTKFVASKRQLIDMLLLVKEKYYVQEINSDRISPYRTTYLDTDNYAQYMQHHNGHATRTKVRVRTYLSSGDLTFLEVKKKNNHARTKKKRIQVKSLETAKQEEGASELVWKRTQLHLEDMHPIVQNHFNRITLVNKGKTERLTIDFNVSFHNFETGLDRDTGNIVVIELKRDGNIFSPIKDILRDLHIHPTGFSKCCIGMALTDPHLKQNNFKQKLRLLQKINADETYRIRPYEDDVY
ncbi:MAG: polyphosphate polymerase domain-containing protein [Bacteroidaceae bacterium]|nr:polyphosphate polymerase domain-containing protein [Bacteroidaceae bacterium]